MDSSLSFEPANARIEIKSTDVFVRESSGVTPPSTRRLLDGVTMLVPRAAIDGASMYAIAKRDLVNCRVSTRWLISTQDSSSATTSSSSAPEQPAPPSDDAVPTDPPGRTRR